MAGGINDCARLGASALEECLFFHDLHCRKHGGIGAGLVAGQKRQYIAHSGWTALPEGIEDA